MSATAAIEGLTAARRRSVELLAPVPTPVLQAQHSPLMSPLAWDVGHVANYEELWLLRHVAGTAAARPELDDLYDAFRHPRATRSGLAILTAPEARRYAADIRARVLDAIGVLKAGHESPLLCDAYVHGMVIQHEHQHTETMLAALQLLDGAGYSAWASLPSRAAASGARRPARLEEVLIPGGAFPMGTNSRAWTLDNERPAHLVDVPPFFIDTHPVTNGAFAEFVADGGYERPHWWSADGWRWRQEAMLAAPAFWAGDGRGWTVHRLGMVEDVDPSQPVQHVCWYEADAYARWRGARLPTEAEWEKAASWSPDGHKRVWPWGDEPPGPEHANLGQRRWGPAPIGTHPAGASAWGVHEMIGDVWEWTASDFHGYPGFESFPYREYSEVFFGPEYKVLRGGSWATDPVAMRCTFRNWDYPIRRQIFAGFRCARTA